MQFLKRVFNEFNADSCTTLAASLSYYTLFALPPLLYLLLTILAFGLGLAYSDEAADRKAESVIQEQATSLLGNDAASEEIQQIISANQQASGKWWKTLISLVGILFGATGVVVALQDSLNRVWQVGPDPDSGGVWNFVSKRLLSLAIILGLGLLLIVSLVISTILAAMGEQVASVIGMEGMIVDTINYGVQFLFTVILFGAIFRYMPDADIVWKDVAIGATVTAVLFLLGRLGLQVYFSYSEPGAQLGAAAASLAVLLVWIYYSALIFLLGAEITQVYATTYGSGIRPSENAVRVVQKMLPRDQASTTRL